MEIAVAHGYASVRVKGFAEKLARQRRPAQRRESEDWVAGLMALSGQVKRAGGIETAPSDSPLAGVTPESFRAEVAAMRAAEYERARNRPGRA